MVAEMSIRWLAVLALLSHPAVAGPAPAASSQAGFFFNDLAARWDCAGQYCGYSSQLCCVGGAQCYTDALTQAQCGTPPTQAVQGIQIITVTVGGTSPTQAVQCNAAINQTPCGNICCASGQYCYTLGQCVAAGNGGSSGYFNSFAPVTTQTVTASAPIRQTSSSIIYVSSTRVTTTTSRVTTTIPFLTPVATGANITVSGQMLQGGNGGGGLSGGQIAGIVVGVLAALALLALICFCCCLKGIFDGILAIFGLGKRKRRTEVEEYERVSHHGRTGFFGLGSRPSRVSRKDEKSHEGRNLLGIGAVLAGLWAILGLKRRREERKQEDKRTEYSYNSSYYTSASSASSDDRPPPPRSARYDRSSSRRP